MTPAISSLLRKVVAQRRNRLPSLMLCVVRQSITWRRKKGNPLTRQEVDSVNALAYKLGFKIKDLLDPKFLNSLPGSDSVTPTRPSPSTAPLMTKDVQERLQRSLLDMSSIDPQKRGYDFEKWLVELFGIYQLAPRGAFRNTGEQIDGSFELSGRYYLFEAKWQNDRTSISDLLTFAGKVDGKAVWAHGVFVSYSGFSPDALVAFNRGRRTNIVAIDGLDLSQMLTRSVSFVDLLGRKLRAAAESNEAYVPFRDLYA